MKKQTKTAERLMKRINHQPLLLKRIGTLTTFSPPVAINWLRIFSSLQQKNLPCPIADLPVGLKRWNS
jgi:hypothetical protein